MGSRWETAEGRAWALGAEAGIPPWFCHYLVITGMEEGLLGSRQSRLLVTPFPRGLSTSRRPSGALPTRFLQQGASCGTEGPWGWAGVDIRTPPALSPFHRPLPASYGPQGKKQSPLLKGAWGHGH